MYNLHLILILVIAVVVILIINNNGCKKMEGFANYNGPHSTIFTDAICPNMGAVNGDLDNCKRVCDSRSGCTAFNFNPSLSLCYLRECANGNNPSTTALPGWASYTKYQLNAPIATSAPAPTPAPTRTPAPAPTPPPARTLREIVDLILIKRNTRDGNLELIRRNNLENTRLSNEINTLEIELNDLERYITPLRRY